MLRQCRRCQRTRAQSAASLGYGQLMQSSCRAHDSWLRAKSMRLYLVGFPALRSAGTLAPALAISTSNSRFERRVVFCTHDARSNFARRLKLTMCD
jgi:hypothetical protein